MVLCGASHFNKRFVNDSCKKRMRNYFLTDFPCVLICRPKRTLYSKKYGVDLIRYTHAANTVVYSSNKIDGMFKFFLQRFFLLLFSFSFVIACVWRPKCMSVGDRK